MHTCFRLGLAYIVCTMVQHRSTTYVSFTYSDTKGKKRAGLSDALYRCRRRVGGNKQKKTITMMVMIKHTMFPLIGTFSRASVWMAASLHCTDAAIQTEARENVPVSHSLLRCNRGITSTFWSTLKNLLKKQQIREFIKKYSPCCIHHVWN